MTTLQNKKSLVRSALRTALPVIPALVALAAPAQAQLAGQFASVLEVDAEYVSGANGATDIAFAPDGRAVVTRRTGQVVIRRLNGTVNVVSAFTTGIDTGGFGEKGLLGVVADPGSPNTFYFYVSNGSTNADKHRVYRAVLTDDDGLTVDSVPVIGAERGNGPGIEGPQNHNGGGLVIHDGYLYIGTGDTGANATPPTNKYGSCLNKGNGKILRVALDGSIPDDNPLVGVNQATSCDSPTGDWGTAAPDQRIYAWGFRNAFRFWIDPQTDLLWIGDVGESTREEVTVGGMGEHHGYPFVEGDVNHRASSQLSGFSSCTDTTPSKSCTAPVYAYQQSGERAITGGLIPEGCGWSNVFSTPHYVFGDSSQSWMRALPVNTDRTGVSSTTAVQFGSYPASARPVAFKMGPDESLYIVLHGSGAVHRYTPVERSGADCLTDPGGTGGSGGMGGDGGEGPGGSPTGTGGTESSPDPTASPSEGGGGNGGTAVGGTGGNGGSGPVPPTPTPTATTTPGIPTPTPPIGVSPSPGSSPAPGSSPTPGATTPPTASPAPGDSSPAPVGSQPQPTGSQSTAAPVAPPVGGPTPSSGPVGSTSASASGSADAVDSGDDAGCACRTAGRPSHGQTPAMLGVLLGLAAIALGRRRRQAE